MKELLFCCIIALFATSAFAKLKVFVVYSHQEPQSFCAALKDTVIQTLKEEGHKVQVTDLYASLMFNRIDKTDFVDLADPLYFRPQVEQANANKNRSNWARELQAEYDKADWADLFIFIYPYYLSYWPGIQQAWSERVFSYGFAFGPGGDHLKGKKGMLIYTTGGGKQWIEKQEKIMWFLIHDRMKFWGMTNLEPFGAYSPAYIDDAARKKILEDLVVRMKGIENEYYAN